MFWIGFIVGAFIGTIAGIGIVAILSANGKGD